jgi:two-component system capsular synthesis response regulator RcsB
MNNMNVIIADDHPIVLFGIRKSLEQIEWVNVVGEFEDSTALINNLPKLDAHVLITDLSMPEINTVMGSRSSNTLNVTSRISRSLF